MIKNRINLENGINSIPDIFKKLNINKNLSTIKKFNMVFSDFVPVTYTINGLTVELKLVNPADIYIDHNVQRNPDINHILYIMSNYNPYYAKPATLVYDPVSKLTFAPDVQHGLISAYGLGLTKIPAIVYTLPYKTIEENRKFMAIMFNNLNKVKPIGAYMTLKNERNGIGPKADRANKIFDIVEQEGCRLVQYKSKLSNTISHITYVCKIYDEFGSGILRATLKFMKTYFPDEPIEAPILIAIARFYKNNEMNNRVSGINQLIDNDILYHVITQGKTVTNQNKINTFLGSFETNTDANGTSYDKLKARAIYHHYNNYCKTNKIASLSMSKE